MAKHELVYVILNKKGRIFLESGRLPIYWRRHAAKERADELAGTVKKLSLDDLTEFINKS